MTGSVSCNGGWSVSATGFGEIFNGTLSNGGTVVGGTWSFSPPGDTGPWTGSVKPVVNHVRPSSGSANGGGTVTIRGSGFENATTVDFGSHPATHVVVSANFKKISVGVPEGTGNVDVTVTTPNGTSKISPADEYSYH